MGTVMLTAICIFFGAVGLLVLHIFENETPKKHLKKIRQLELRKIERIQNSMKDHAKQEWVKDENDNLVLRDLEYYEKKAFYQDNAFAEDVNSLADKEYK